MTGVRPTVLAGVQSHLCPVGEAEKGLRKQRPASSQSLEEDWEGGNTERQTSLRIVPAIHPSTIRRWTSRGPGSRPPSTSCASCLGVLPSDPSSRNAVHCLHCLHCAPGVEFWRSERAIGRIAPHQVRAGNGATGLVHTESLALVAGERAQSRAFVSGKDASNKKNLESPRQPASVELALYVSLKKR
eukprot:6171927-Pleurochrysis_carterae.AAC.2